MSSHVVRISDFISNVSESPLQPWCDSAPWRVTVQAESLVRQWLTGLSPGDYRIADEIAVHREARIESGAVLKGPLIVGPDCFVAAGAYLRGGNWLQARCILGPGTELKSSFLFVGAALAHFNFVGDSILGHDVNLEAGSVICNHRNERTERQIFVAGLGGRQGTGVEKFGALLGDGVRIGANAVLAPGTWCRPGSVVARLAHVDQDPLVAP